MTMPGLLENIPHQTGFLIINEDGAVSSSGGDLENDEHTANIVVNIVKLADQKDLLKSTSDAWEPFRRLTITFENHLYAITLSNKKLHVVKRKFSSNAPVLV